MPSDTANPLGGAIRKLHFTRLMYTFQVFEDVTMLFSQLFLQQPTHAVLQVLQWPWLHLRLSFQTEACLAAGGQHNGTHRHEAEDVPVRQRCGTSSTAAPLLLPKVSPRASHRATATSRARPGLRLRLRPEEGEPGRGGWQRCDHRGPGALLCGAGRTEALCERPKAVAAMRPPPPPSAARVWFCLWAFGGAVCALPSLL